MNSCHINKNNVLLSIISLFIAIAPQDAFAKRKGENMSEAYDRMATIAQRAGESLESEKEVTKFKLFNDMCTVLVKNYL